MNHGFDNNDNNQFVVSYELLQLFKWLFEHEQEAVKKLLEKALHHGLQEQFFSPTSEENSEALQQSIIDFFALLETLMYELLNEDEIKRVLERNLIPAINHIDASVYDHNALAASVAKATTAYEHNPHEDPKAIFCKELLKRWKPSKKTSMH